MPPLSGKLDDTIMQAGGKMPTTQVNSYRQKAFLTDGETRFDLDKSISLISMSLVDVFFICV